MGLSCYRFSSACVPGTENTVFCQRGLSRGPARTRRIPYRRAEPPCALIVFLTFAHAVTCALVILRRGF